MFAQPPASTQILSFCLLTSACSKTLSETDATDVGHGIQGQPPATLTDGLGLGSQHDRWRAEELQRRIEKRSFLDEQKREQTDQAVDANTLQIHLDAERRRYTVKNQERMDNAQSKANNLFIRAQFLTAKRRETFETAWQIYDVKHREAFSRLQSIEASSTAIDLDSKIELEKCMVQLEQSVKNVDNTFSVGQVR